MMMYDLGVAWRNIRSQPIQAIIPALVIGLAIALTLTVTMLADGTKEGIIKASDPFGVIVVGAKGSPKQLVLNSVLLQDDPIGNIPYQIYTDLAQDDRVQLAVPLAIADQIEGARIIGTDHNFFELRASNFDPPAFQIKQGRIFAEVEEGEEDSDDHHEEGLFEAVLGAKAAEELGLGIGDFFTTSHGRGQRLELNTHEDIYEVVGILKLSDTPYDSAVFTQIESIWAAHEIDPNDPLAPYLAEVSGSEDSVTAVLVRPATISTDIAVEINNGNEAQAAFPGQELVELFDQIDQAQDILTMVGYLVLGIATLTVFLAMYNAIRAREQNIAIMRGLGCSQTSIFRMVLFETLIVTALGALLGRMIGYPTVSLIADNLSNRSAIPIPLRVLVNWELLLVVLPLGVGAIAGLIPAAMAYRVNVVEKLFPS